jgi:hypothetical protein
LQGSTLVVDLGRVHQLSLTRSQPKPQKCGQDPNSLQPPLPPRPQRTQPGGARGADRGARGSVCGRARMSRKDAIAEFPTSPEKRYQSRINQNLPAKSPRWLAAMGYGGPSSPPEVGRMYGAASLGKAAYRVDYASWYAAKACTVEGIGSALPTLPSGASGCRRGWPPRWAGQPCRGGRPHPARVFLGAVTAADDGAPSRRAADDPRPVDVTVSRLNQTLQRLASEQFSQISFSGSHTCAATTRHSHISLRVPSLNFAYVASNRGARNRPRYRSKARDCSVLMEGIIADAALHLHRNKAIAVLWVSL